MDRFPPAAQPINAKHENSLSAWFQVLRLHFVPPSFLPAILGSTIAWSSFDFFSFVDFTLVVMGVTINHLGLNMIDDVFDYLHAVDRFSADQLEKNPYSGGSGVLTAGLLPVASVLGAAIGCFIITFSIALYLTVVKGWVVLALALFGLLSSLFYTMPPVKYGYRGFGELGLLLNFGPVIVVGAFYVQTGFFALEPFIASLVPGFMMWSMIIINEIPDYEEDREGGKWNLVARFGTKNAVRLYIGGLLAAYGSILVSVLLRLIPAAALLGFASLPLALSSIKTARNKYNDRTGLAPANLAMIKIHFLTLSGLIGSYILCRLL